MGHKNWKFSTNEEKRDIKIKLSTNKRRKEANKPKK
jgi:hypothetical protein